MSDCKKPKNKNKCGRGQDNGDNDEVIINQQAVLNKPELPARISRVKRSPRVRYRRPQLQNTLRTFSPPRDFSIQDPNPKRINPK